MEAINLIHKYDQGRIDIGNTGIFTCLDEEDVSNPDGFLKWMFGGGIVINGGIEVGKTYIYAYAQRDEMPDGFDEDDYPDMVAVTGDGYCIYIYEIEDV